MLKNLESYCSSMTGVLETNNSKTEYYNMKLDDKVFDLYITGKEVKIHLIDNDLFTAFCTVLQSKYKTLLTIKKNVNLLGKVRPYHLIQFCCVKKTKIKLILGQVERLYFEIKNENEKVGI